MIFDISLSFILAGSVLSKFEATLWQQNLFSMKRQDIFQCVCGDRTRSLKINTMFSVFHLSSGT